MASPAKKSLAERMAPRKSATTSPELDKLPSVSASFKNAQDDYVKRLTLDLTAGQHRKLKLHAMNEGTTMNQVLRDFIDSLPS